jgi:tetratricopeptide (TPR) repeat protein
VSAATARQRGLLLLRTGRPRAAVDAFCEALAFEPDDADLHAWLALALLDARRLHAARAEAELAVGHAADGRLPLYALGRVRLAERRWKDAEAVFLQLVAIAPGDADHYRALASVYEARGDRKRAGEMLLHARSLAPASPDVLAELAELRLEERRLDEAEELAKAALGEQAEHAEALVVMGRVLLERGKVAEAREHAVSVLRQRPDHPGAVLLLVAAKARTSWVLGLWWRYHTRMVAFGHRAWIVLLVAFAIKNFAVLLADDFGPPWLSDDILTVWLLFAAYTWIGPGLFQQAFRNELRPVTLKPDF